MRAGIGGGGVDGGGTGIRRIVAATSETYGAGAGGTAGGAVGLTESSIVSSGVGAHDGTAGCCGLGGVPDG